MGTTTRPAPETVTLPVNAHIAITCLARDVESTQATIAAYQAERAALSARGLSFAEFEALESAAWDRTIGTVL